MSKQQNPQAADTAIPDHIDPTVAKQYPSLAESTVSREVVYEGRFLKVRKDVARTPDGSTNTREFIMHPGALDIDLFIVYTDIVGFARTSRTLRR